jgi:DNA-binding NarL/FixJ family response regulator
LHDAGLQTQMRVQPHPTSQPIRVLVADDHEPLRRAVCGLLAALDDVEVVGVAASGLEAVELASATAPDVAVIDVSMPGLDGIEAMRRMLAADPGLRVVILTASRDRRDDALRAGAAVHLLKDAEPQELVACVRALAKPERSTRGSATMA